MMSFYGSTIGRASFDTNLGYSLINPFNPSGTAFDCYFTFVVFAP